MAKRNEFAVCIVNISVNLRARPDGICNPVRNISSLPAGRLNVLDGIANPVRRRSFRLVNPSRAMWPSCQTACSPVVSLGSRTVTVVPVSSDVSR